MAILEWDKSGEKLYETGVKKGVLFVMENGEYQHGVVWNGLSSVTESPSGAEATAIYADDQKYLNLYSAEEFSATVEAYMYPDKFAECDGSADLQEGISVGQQARKTFALAYSTIIGNDEDGNEYGEKIHIIYGAKAAPSEKAYNSVNDSPEANTFSWELSTTPINVAGMKPTATVVIDSTKVDPSVLKQIKDSLYGTASEESTLLLPDQLKALVPVNG